MIRCLRLSRALLLCFVAGTAGAADYRLGIGVEQFYWEERNDMGGRILEESGPRLVLDLNAYEYSNLDWRTGVNARLYGARVAYDGQYQNGAPLHDDTDYFGGSAELEFVRWMHRTKAEGTNGRLGLLFGVGYEAWRRDLKADGGYRENYGVSYARLGLLFETGPQWSFSGGAKYPFHAREDISLTDVGYDSDPRLEPEGVASVFAAANFRFDRQWSVGIRYDSYRFDKSGVELVNQQGTPHSVWQPEIRQSAIGIHLSRRL